MRFLSSARPRPLVLGIGLLAACGDRPEQPFVPGPPPEPIWAVNAVQVFQSPGSRLAANNGVAGGRANLGTMHLFWEDGTVLRHGFVTLTQTAWQVLTVPTFSSAATVRRPVVSYASGGTFLAAWLEQLGATHRIVVSRSLDYGATWESPISLVASTEAISSPVLYAYQRATGTLGAVVAWSDAPTAPAVRVRATTWRGAAWSAADWTAPAPVSSNTSGSAQQVTIDGRGEEVIAVWSDSRAASGVAGLFSARSTNGGQSWGPDALIGVPIGSSAVGTEPSVTLGPGADMALAWSHQGAVWVSRSSDRGVNWSAPLRLGPGHGGQAAIGDPGRIAIGWTNGAAAGTDENTHSLSLAVSGDNLLTMNAPNAMPGSAGVAARTSVRLFITGPTLDLIWIDVSGGTRSIQHRTARLP
jgi:hypothetical protein